MQVQAQVKIAIKQLPPAERVIAIALKGIYEQVKQLLSEQKKQIDQNHLKYIDEFRQLQKKAGIVIKGKSLTEQQLINDKDYFMNEEEKDKKNIMKEGHKLKDYWLKSIKNSEFKHLLNQADQKILSNLQQISTNVTTDFFQIKFQFSQSQSTFKETYTRKLTLVNGSPTNFDGDLMKFKIPLQDGLFQSLNNDSTDLHALTTILNIMSQIISEIVPYSLQYYMNIQNQDFDQQEEYEDGIDDQDEQQDGQPQKKVKND